MQENREVLEAMLFMFSELNFSIDGDGEIIFWSSSLYVALISGNWTVPLRKLLVMPVIGPGDWLLIVTCIFS